MPPKVFEIKLTPDGWKATIEGLTPRQITNVFKKHVRRATKRNAIRLQGRIRQGIRSGVKPQNAALTKTIKGNRGNRAKPLVDQGDLFNAITYDVQDWDLAFIGVKRTNKEYNLALMLHQGAIIKVTNEMRHMFWLLYLVSKGDMSPEVLEGRAKKLWDTAAKKKFYPLSKKTKAIIIPARPFIRNAMRDPGLKKEVEKEWNTSIRQAFKEIASKAGK